MRWRHEHRFTGWVTAVVPLSPRYSTPSLGRVATDAGTFVFRGIPLDILDAAAETDRLEPQLSYRRATPEAALLHWLYLARVPRSRMSPPSADLDIASLESRRLKRLAKAMSLEGTLREWREGIEVQRFFRGKQLNINLINTTSECVATALTSTYARHMLPNP